MVFSTNFTSGIRHFSKSNKAATHQADLCLALSHAFSSCVEGINWLYQQIYSLFVIQKKKTKQGYIQNVNKVVLAYPYEHQLC